MKSGVFERRPEAAGWAWWHYLVAGGALLAATTAATGIAAVCDAIHIPDLSLGQAWSNKAPGMGVSWAVAVVCAVSWRGKALPASVRWALLAAFFTLPLIHVGLVPPIVGVAWTTARLVVVSLGVGMIGRVITEWIVQRWPD
jgi:hypothetical protein